MMVDDSKQKISCIIILIIVKSMVTMKFMKVDKNLHYDFIITSLKGKKILQIFIVYEILIKNVTETKGEPNN